MKQILSFVKAIVTGAAMVAALALPAAAITPQQTICEGSGGTWNGTACETTDGKPQVVTTFGTVSNILLFILGAIAVVMIIVGGIRYVTSNGDQAQVTGAKNTIMYAVIGIIVAFAAYAIVNFVTAQISKNNTYNPSGNRVNVATLTLGSQQI